MSKPLQIILLVVFVGLVVVLPALVGQLAVQGSEQLSYQNSIKECERINPLRQVVFLNTQNAVSQARDLGDTEVTEVFGDNLQTLQSTPGIDNDTGIINCAEVVKEP